MNQDINGDNIILIDIKYNNKFRKVLFEKINNMTKTEHEEIFKIIRDKNSNVNYSKNKNGVFLNLSSLNDETIHEVNNFVTYCINNKKELDDYDKKLNECKINNYLSNIASLNNNLKIGIDEMDDWNSLVPESKSIQKISTFVEKLMNDHDRIGKKKINQKFSNAKKKYSKKVCIERKFETEDNIELNNDTYIII
jgi:hypothetical protein